VKLVLDEKTYWLDAANGPFAFADLPGANQSIRAMVLDRDTFHFDMVAPHHDEERMDSRFCRGALGADGSYAFHVTATMTGESAARIRHQMIDRTEEHRLRVLQAWLGGDFLGAIGGQFTYDSVEDLAKGFGYSCDAKQPRVARQIKDIVLFRIPWSAPLSMGGPMSAARRNQPLAVPTMHHLYDRHEIELPEGVSAFAIPDPVELQCEWGSYSCRTQEEGRRLIAERRLRLRGPAVPKERFAEFQNFWRDCAWSDTAEIVLRRR
jgi:hypothetical protein